MRHRAHALAAPPGGARVARDALAAADARRVAVGRLDAPVVVAGREVDDRHVAGGGHRVADVRRDAAAAGEHAVDDRLEVREAEVGPDDPERDVPGLDSSPSRSVQSSRSW